MPDLQIFKSWHTCMTLEQVDIWSFVTQDKLMIVYSSHEWKRLNSTYKMLSTKKQFPAMFAINIGLLYTWQSPNMSISKMESLKYIIINQVVKGIKGNDTIKFSCGWDPKFLPNLITKEGHTYKEREILG